LQKKSSSPVLELHPLFSDPGEDHPGVSALPDAVDAGAELPKILDSQLPRSCAVSFQLDFGCSAAGLACAVPAGAVCPLCPALGAAEPVCAFALLAMAMIMMPTNTATGRLPQKSDTCFMAIPLWFVQ
jgi:hypothetical protein